MFANRDRFVPAVKRIYARIQQSWTTRSGLIVLLIVIPDWVARGGFWYSTALWIWPSLKKAYDSPYSKISLVALAFLAIALDQRRLTRTRERDLATLKGRTLKLRDDVQAFLESVPKATGYLGASQQGTIERLSSQASFVMGRLEHGYYLQFADRISRIYHEFGERGVQDKELTRAIAEKKYEQALTYGTIIDALTRLAGCPEASANDLNGLTPAAFKHGFRDDMTVREYRKAREKGQI
jgi:hypothetical protein